MEDKIVIITGANSGIGKAAALKFATEGYHVVMACRNMELSKLVQREVITVSKNEHVDLMELDVSSFHSIHQFCSTYKSRYQKLDLLIHNAAYLNHGEKNYQLSRDQIELTFATNTFGPFLMTHLLVDYLEKSEDPRILNACTTNIKHFFNPTRVIDFNNLRGELRDTKPYNVYKMYGDSKMALLLLTFKMADAFESRGIKINALQINRVKISKETLKKLSYSWRVLARVQNFTSQLPISMANHYFHICTSDKFKEVTGKLINHKREIVQPALSHDTSAITLLKNIFGSGFYPKYATDSEIIEQVWRLSIQLTEAIGSEDSTLQSHHLN